MKLARKITRQTARKIASIAAAACSLLAAHSSFALTINASWDASFTDPTAKQTILNTIGIYESTFSDPFTVNIMFANMNSGLGQSSTWFYSRTYTSFYNHLSTDATSANDTTALSHLSSGSSDPLLGSTVYLSHANANALGYNFGPTPNGLDGTISLNMSLINTTRTSIDPSRYDLQAVASHEIDEVLGISSGLGSNLHPRPVDLFRYDASGNRTFTTSGDNAYFSIDGGRTLLIQYNNDGNGDYGDWHSSGTPFVQNAYGTPGATPNLARPEITALDVTGYDVKAPVPEPETYAMMLLGMSMLGGLQRRRAHTGKPGRTTA
ncbi:MAG: NF038122 family metalloprotease [Leptothrix sp. (in: b-proteobacteria)]